MKVLGFHAHQVVLLGELFHHLEHLPGALLTSEFHPQLPDQIVLAEHRLVLVHALQDLVKGMRVQVLAFGLLEGLGGGDQIRSFLGDVGESLLPVLDHLLERRFFLLLAGRLAGLVVTGRWVFFDVVQDFLAAGLRLEHELPVDAGDAGEDLAGLASLDVHFALAIDVYPSAFIAL